MTKYEIFKIGEIDEIRNLYMEICIYMHGARDLSNYFLHILQISAPKMFVCGGFLRLPSPLPFLKHVFFFIKGKKSLYKYLPPTPHKNASSYQYFLFCKCRIKQNKSMCGGEGVGVGRKSWKTVIF